MKKTILTLILAAAVSASLLAGCGNAAEPVNSNNVVTNDAETADVANSTETECSHEWIDATCEEAKHCSKCGETEGVALGHTLTEATFKEAAVCTVCGKTEGEPKKSYFEEHGENVLDAPVACTVNMVNYSLDNPEEYQMTMDGTWEQLDCYSEPADEEGYQLIHLELCRMVHCHYYAAQDITYGNIQSFRNIYDWYTGRLFPTRNWIGDGVYEFDFSTTVDIDGVSYVVSYTKESQSEWGDWILDDNGDYYSNDRIYETFIFKVPDGYDGLVFAAIPTNEYRELDTETVYGTGTTEEGEENEEDIYYAFDEGHYTDGTKFFRINKEGTVPERVAEDSEDTAE